MTGSINTHGILVKGSEEEERCFTQKAQGSFGVLMYSIVIISQSSTEWILAYKYLSYFVWGIVVIIIINMNMIILILTPPPPSGYWTIRVFCIAV